MFEFVLSGLRSGIRGRSLQAVFALGVLTIVAAYLSGSFSPRQPQTVAMDIGFSGVRISLVFLNLLWIQELVTREIDRRTVFFSLTYPVSRGAFLIGRFGAVLVLSVMAAVILGFMLTSAVALAGGGYNQELSPSLGLPFWASIAGLVIDAGVVAVFALCVATISTVYVLPLALGAAFAVAGKALGAVMDYLAGGADGDVDLVARVGPLVNAIRWVLPDLSRLDWRSWPMYAQALAEGEIVWSMIMAISYAAILMVLAVRLFRRREFS